VPSVLIVTARSRLWEFAPSLIGAGFELAHESGPNEALERLRTLRPDVIIVDADIWRDAAPGLFDLRRVAPSSRVLLTIGDRGAASDIAQADAVVVMPLNAEHLVSAVWLLLDKPSR
jgi:CheY-like chemotaxis protein